MQLTQALDDLLCARYPALYADRHGDKQSTSMCWGFELGDGWFAIIDALSEVLTFQAKSAGVACPVAQQVKQKLGSLRFRIEAPEAGRHTIALAEEMSRRICEVSGQPGRLCCFGRRRTATLSSGIRSSGVFGGQKVSVAATEADPMTGGMDVPPLAFGLDDMARWRADVLAGPVEVPVGWLDLADALLHVVQRERMPLKPASIRHIGRGVTGERAMNVEWAENGPPLEGLSAMASALSQRIDPASGAMDAGASCL